MTELLIAIFQAAGAITGILGTFAFEILHNKFKIFLPTLGLIGTSYQLFFLFCCFVSIWLPGSPFVLADELFSTAKNACDYTNSTNNSSLSNEQLKFQNAFFLTYCNPIISILVLLSAMAISRSGSLKHFLIG